MSHLYGITIWQPWAWCIAQGAKRLENRNWVPSQLLRGERIAIHAGKQYDYTAPGWCLRKFGIRVPLQTQVALGAIVATAVYRGAVYQSNDPWFTGPFGWLLDDVRALAQAVPCRGMQGIWPVPAEIAARVFAEIK